MRQTFSRLKSRSFLGISLALLGCASFAGAATAKAPPTAAQLAAASDRLGVPQIENGSEYLLGLPGTDLAKGQALLRLRALSDHLQVLYEEPDPQILGGLFRSDVRLASDLSGVYSDARYASRLPSIPLGLQKWLGELQVSRALDDTRAQEKKLRDKGLASAEAKKELAAMEAKRKALKTLGTKIAKAATPTDLEGALTSLSDFYEGGASAAGKVQAPGAPADGVRARAGLKSFDYGPAAPKSIAPKASVPPVAAAETAPSAAAPRASFLPSLRVAVAALKSSFPLPFDPAMLARDSSVEGVKRDAMRAWAGVQGFEDNCQNMEAAGARSISDQDCRQAQALDARYRSTLRAMGKAGQAGDGDAYYQTVLALGHWKDDVDSFLRAYMAQWLAAENQTPGGLTQALQATGFDKPLNLAGAVLSPLGNAGSSAYYHAAGLLSAGLGQSEQAAAKIYASGAKLFAAYGMNGLSEWSASEGDSMQARAREDTAYGVATMIQSPYAVMPREWYAASPEVQEDLKVFAVDHQARKWGDALPAAAYLGIVNLDPTNPEVVSAVHEGAGGLKGASELMLEEAAADWGKGGASNKLAAAGLWTMVTTVKAGDMAAQSLAFMGVGGALGAAAQKAGAASNVARAVNVYKVASEVGKYPFYVGLAKSGTELVETAASELPKDAKRRRLFAQSSEFAASASPLALGGLAKEPQGAAAPARAPEAVSEVRPLVSGDYADEVLAAMGEQARAQAAARPLVMGAAAPRGGVAIETIRSAGRSEYTINGKPVARIGAGSIKDVVEHPSDPELVVKVFQVGDSIGAKRQEMYGQKALEQAGAAPKTLETGAVANGGKGLGYIVQERVRGADLRAMTPVKYKAVADLFDRLTASRISLEGDHDWKVAENIMVGVTKSAPNDLRAYVVDADGVEQAPKPGLLDRLSGKPDPLRAYYDKLLAGYRAQMSRGGTVFDEAAVRAPAPPKTAASSAEPAEQTAGADAAEASQAAWDNVKQDVLDTLQKQGIDPAAAAAALEQKATASPDLQERAVLYDPAERRALAESLRFSALKEQTVSALEKEGYSRSRVENWLDRNQDLAADMSQANREELIRRQFKDIDQAVTRMKALRAKGDYDGVLRYAEEVEAQRPDLRPYIVPWKNNAFRNVYLEALSGKNSLKAMQADYAIARDEGRVTVFSSGRNVERQTGPTCAIHTLHNILTAQLERSGSGQAPDYKSFERSVQEFFPGKAGEVVGVDRGLTPGEIGAAARAMGFQTEEIVAPPKTAAGFDALLKRGGAAYVGLRMSDAAGKITPASSHAVFVTEKWTARDGRELYGVVDSNGGPDDVSFYTWEQLGPRIGNVTLLSAADPASFAAQAKFFTMSAAGPGSVPGSRRGPVYNAEVKSKASAAAPEEIRAALDTARSMDAQGLAARYRENAAALSSEASPLTASQYEARGQALARRALEESLGGAPASQRGTLLSRRAADGAWIAVDPSAREAAVLSADGRLKTFLRLPIALPPEKALAALLKPEAASSGEETVLRQAQTAAEAASPGVTPQERKRLKNFLQAMPGLIKLAPSNIERLGSDRTAWRWTSWNGSDHFKKHGEEFSGRLGRDTTQSDYQAMGQDLMRRALQEAAAAGLDGTSRTLLFHRKAGDALVAIDLVNRDVALSSPNGTMVTFYHIYPGKTFEQTIQQVLSLRRAP